MSKPINIQKEVIDVHVIQNKYDTFYCNLWKHLKFKKFNSIIGIFICILFYLLDNNNKY